jgi:sugar phosphate isomerase/epimerase
MQIGFSSMALISHSLFKKPDDHSTVEALFLKWSREALEFGEQHKFEFIELIVESPLIGGAHDDFVKLCKQFKIPKTVHAPFISNNIISFDGYVKRACVEEILVAMKVTKEIGATRFTFHPGQRSRQLPILNSYFNMSFLESVGTIVKEFKQKYTDNFRLCIENMPAMEIFFKNPEEIQNYLTLPLFQPVWLTLDSSHAWTAGGDTILQDFAKRFAGRIGHTHLVDNQTFDNDPHIAIGSGKIDFTSFLRTLIGTGYNDLLTMEIIGIKATLESREQILKILEKLKST